MTFGSLAGWTSTSAVVAAIGAVPLFTTGWAVGEWGTAIFAASCLVLVVLGVAGVATQAARSRGNSLTRAARQTAVVASGIAVPDAFIFAVAFVVAFAIDLVPLRAGEIWMLVAVGGYYFVATVAIGVAAWAFLTPLGWGIGRLLEREWSTG